MAWALHLVFVCFSPLSRFSQEEDECQSGRTSTSHSRASDYDPDGAVSYSAYLLSVMPTMEGVSASIPAVPLPSRDDLPAIPALPALPELPSLPDLPDLPDVNLPMPQMPQMPEMPQMPQMPEMPQMPRMDMPDWGYLYPAARPPTADGDAGTDAPEAVGRAPNAIDVVLASWAPQALPRARSLTPAAAAVLAARIGRLSAHQRYRLAVVKRLPSLRVLDGQDVDMRERIVAAHLTDHAAAAYLGEQVCRDEEDGWAWPRDFDPPRAVLMDGAKMRMLREVQRDVEALMPTFRAAAADSFWAVDKKTVLRYCEAARWTPALNGVPLAHAIVETIRWRPLCPLPPRSAADRRRLLDSLHLQVLSTHLHVASPYLIPI